MLVQGLSKLQNVLALLSPPSVNVVKTRGDYEIGRSARRSVVPCVCACVSVYMSLRRHISIMVPNRCMVAMDHP